MKESASTEIQPATASINNEDQNTQNEANISGGKENKNDELVIEIREMFRRPKIQSSTQCRIYKVPHYLRKWNEEAYTPQFISVGPFHHKNQRLKAMEEHKVSFFGSFMEWSKIKLENLVGTVREMEGSIRQCYLETIDLTSDRFVKMILVDACFILELFIREKPISQTSYDSMLVEPWAKVIMPDLLLLENQLPFFVLEKLHELAFPSLSGLSNYAALLELSLNYFGYLCSKFRQDHHNVKIDHFTDLLRTFQLPPPGKLPERDYKQIPYFCSATQLYEAGVKFMLGTGESCFDMKFEGGVLQIPRLELNDWTEVVIRNIMALEQTHYIENAYFTDYFFLMESLIKTKKDVDLLCEKGILVNYLGDNDAAKSLTNNLNKGIIRITMRDDYVDLCTKLNSFCDTRWHRWKALLIRTYFSSSSDFIYLVHNLVIMTVLTIIQTLCSILQTMGPSSKRK